MSKGLRIAVGIVLAAFLLETAIVTWQVGLVGVFEAAFANPATSLMALDLTLCLTLIAVWMWRDARARGGNALPYIALAALLGAAGPLLYLLRRPEREAHVPPRAASGAAQPA